MADIEQGDKMKSGVSYIANLIFSSGIYKNQPYDSVQTSIRMVNHIALRYGQENTNPLAKASKV